MTHCLDPNVHLTLLDRMQLHSRHFILLHLRNRFWNEKNNFAPFIVTFWISFAFCFPGTITKVWSLWLDCASPCITEAYRHNVYTLIDTACFSTSLAMIDLRTLKLKLFSSLFITNLNATLNSWTVPFKHPTNPRPLCTLIGFLWQSLHEIETLLILNLTVHPPV